MYQSPEPDSITRHYVSIGSRQVHYRRAGSGPALVLLHQSPTSSAENTDLIDFFANHFTVIAPDTPGYGLSDLLEVEEPELDYFADALALLFDALGLACAHVYGTHTGAMIAAEFGRLYPRRCTALVLDGYVVLTDEERASILGHYFTRFTPVADGSHLASIWYRMRDQVIFFPWFDKRKAARMKFDVPPPTATHPFLMDLLRALPNEARGYSAAFRYSSHERIKEFTAPTYLLNYESDAIGHHPERLVAWPDCVTRTRYADPGALHLAAIDIFKGHDDPQPPPPPAIGATPPTAQFTRAYAATKAGQLHYESRAGSSDQTVLYLHDLGGSSRAGHDLANSATDLASWLLPDLPGHGETGSIGTDGFSVDKTAALLEEMIASLEVDGLTILADGLAGAIGVALEARLKGKVKAVILTNPIVPGSGTRADLSEQLVPDFSPDSHGGYLGAVWQIVRDRQLFWPWYAPTLANALGKDPDIAPDDLMIEAVDYLKAWPWLKALTGAIVAHDFSGDLARVSVPLHVISTDGGPRRTRAKIAAKCSSASILVETNGGKSALIDNVRMALMC